MVEQASLFGDELFDDAAPGADASGHEGTRPLDDRATAAARAAELRHLLDYHAYRYYALDAPEITDTAFDKLLIELQEIEERYPDLVTPDSYTQRVGGFVDTERSFRASAPYGPHVLHGRRHEPRGARRVARPHGGRARLGQRQLHVRAQDRRLGRCAHVPRGSPSCARRRAATA